MVWKQIALAKTGSLGHREVRFHQLQEYNCLCVDPLACILRLCVDSKAAPSASFMFISSQSSAYIQPAISRSPDILAPRPQSQILLERQANTYLICTGWIHTESYKCMPIAFL
mmetsp:Transcript_35929/g.58087  ORF Transcript_35929/g.58087 Transcript_35929/m.58087 type:complete len:113 (-) Transcript_35929:363-701(-)